MVSICMGFVMPVKLCLRLQHVISTGCTGTALQHVMSTGSTGAALQHVILTGSTGTALQHMILTDSTGTARRRTETRDMQQLREKHQVV